MRNMIRTTGISGLRSGLALALGLLSLVAPALPAAAQDLPHGFAAITVQPETLDFGTMEQNQTRTQDLTIRNDGGIDLDLTEVTPSCGCTVAELKTRKIKPGESAKLAVTFSSKEFQGPQHKILTIRSNDPVTPTLELAVIATVHVPIVVNPQRKIFAFTNARRGVTEEQQAYFTAMDVPRLELKAERVRADLFNVRIQNGVDGDPRQAIVALSVRPDAPYGPINEIVRFGTNDPTMPSIDFEVVGAVLHDLEVRPDQVNFRYLEREKPVHCELRVSTTVKDLKFKVTGAQIDLPEFKVSIEERIPNHETVIVLRGYPISPTDPRAIAAKGRIQGTVRIFTNQPAQPEMQVKVTYLLRL